MGLFAVALALVILGIVMSFTNLFGAIGETGGTWAGWSLFLVGVVLAYVHFAAAPRLPALIRRRRTD